MEEAVKCDYVLKLKYNGIQLGTNGRPVRNGEMTNAIGKELMEKHPHGSLLFDEFPSEDAEDIRKAKELKRAEADRKKAEKAKIKEEKKKAKIKANREKAEKEALKNKK